MATTDRPSFLFAFDFDHTIVDDNSDTFIFKLLKDGVPTEIKNFYDKTNWTEYMNKVFQHMHKEGISVQDICNCVRGMEPTKGMLQLLTTLVQIKTTSSIETTPPRVDLLVISDANNLFISEYLNYRVLDPLANKNDLQTSPFDIISNTSNISSISNNNKCEPLVITPYSLQTTCKICPKNLCKGSALQSYIEGKGPYDAVFYSGDGWNDVCPALKLNQHDFLFPRVGYSLWKSISSSGDKLGISAEIFEWEDAGIINEVVTKRVGRT